MLRNLLTSDILFFMSKRIPLILLCTLIFCGLLVGDEAQANPFDEPYTMLRSLMMAYPDHISGLEWDAEVEDWRMSVGSRVLYWAHGRLLPKEERGTWQKWRAYIDYLYPKDIPDPEEFTPELIARLDSKALNERRSKAPAHHIAFYDALYDGKTRRRIESHITRFDYLGKRVSVHRSIVPQLKRIEKKIQDLARTNAEVRRFVSSIQSIEGYNWREIADSPSRSNHSWGIAVDILPVNWGKKNIYWNWISYWNDKWMLIPPERRWMPPMEVVEIFESEGFVWGGKWLLWDTMHFEWRPELLILQRWGYRNGGMGQ